MNTLLMIYTVVATISAGSASVSSRMHDWRPLGVFATPVACEQARESLGTAAKPRTRCLQGAAR